jgi:hypothetical protein
MDKAIVTVECEWERRAQLGDAYENCLLVEIDRRDRRVIKRRRWRRKGTYVRGA